MTDRKQDRVELYYICGSCKTEQTYLKGEMPPVPCRYCGWSHKNTRPEDIPSKIKLPLSQYGG